jgi:hypothetical protein
MKRHANRLLQRKLAEFENSSERSRLQADVREAVVEVRDGYDWLQVIKQTSEQRTLARS